MSQCKQYDKEFKENAVQYFLDHEDMGVTKCARNLGISKSTLSAWKQIFDQNEGCISSRGRGNYDSDKSKEIAKLTKELRDTQDALDILKKAISILGG